MNALSSIDYKIWKQIKSKVGDYGLEMKIINNTELKTWEKMIGQHLDRGYL